MPKELGNGQVKTQVVLLHVPRHCSVWALKGGYLLSSVTTPLRVGWPCSHNLNSDLDELQVAVPFEVSGITSLPRMWRIIRPLSMKEMWGSGNTESWGPIHVSVKEARKARSGLPRMHCACASHCLFSLSPSLPRTT